MALNTCKLAAVLALAVLLPHYATAQLPPTSPVVQWTYLLQQDLRDVRNLQNQVGSKYYALQALAVWNAVKANRGGRIDGKPKYNETAVVAFASHTVLTHIFPWWFFRHDLLISSQLAGLPAFDLAGAKGLGQAEANKLLDDRVNDGFAEWANFKPAPYNTPGTIGQYQFTPNQTYALYPQYGYSKTFVLTKSDVDVIVNRYKNKVKGYFQSDEYYSDLKYTQQVGELNAKRSSYDNDTGLFWAGRPGTSLIHGQFINISIALLPKTWGIPEQARYFAQLGVAISDASVACYRTKYEVLLWRPVTAINLGDGSGKYKADPNWRTALPTPPHPSYPSGHQCISQPAVNVIKAALGKSKATFSVYSEDIPGQVRNFTDVDAIIGETTLSRIFIGVHFRRDNTDGLLLGADATTLVLSRLK